MNREKDKIILDACCGGRMMWFDKKNPLVVFVDKYPRPKGIIPIRPNFSCEPDEVMDFTALQFPDKSFKMVLFDPPHLKRLGKTSVMAKKYGTLLPGWEHELTKGFDECMRVLDDYGTLIFKWNTRDYKVAQVLKLFSQKPLFGHPSGKAGNTMWMAFMKLPINKDIR